jgi:hypothetical protein
VSWHIIANKLIADKPGERDDDGENEAGVFEILRCGIGSHRNDPGIARVQHGLRRAKGRDRCLGTSEKNRFARMSGLRWRTAAAKPSEQAIILNPEKEFQTILGFGAAFTDALATCSTSSRHPHASGCFMLHPH